MASLIDAWAPGPHGEARPDWTRLRAFLDWLTLHPTAKDSATLHRPQPSGSSLIDNLLAGMAEKICDDAGLRRPPWTRQVRPLPEWWEQPGTVRMREAARAATPIQFLDRHIVLATSGLWRDRATVGV